MMPRVRSRKLLALLGAAALLPAAGLLVTTATRPAAAEPVAQKKTPTKPQPKDSSRPSYYVGRLFRITVERESTEPEYTSIWTNTSCEVVDGAGNGATWYVAYQRIDPSNRRRATLWFTTTPLAPLGPGTGVPAPAPGASGSVMITVWNAGAPEPPTMPIPVEPAIIDPCS